MGGATGIILDAPSVVRGNTQVQVDVGGLIVSAKLSDMRRASHPPRVRQDSSTIRKKTKRTVGIGSPASGPLPGKSITGQHRKFSNVSGLQRLYLVFCSLKVMCKFHVSLNDTYFMQLHAMQNIKC